ncbi:type IX secretion system membrane protein PorP/SprF [Flavobacterium beibuense]|uniref:Bacteroidetes-specific putative membrane protein n=1 Tax=Flavobacterium beibuense TaxID=657326 RepID=A0A444W851_9FLAO|nr:type IX secretion system membrane protein PorP/SprF [Flavobacterium beibuense]RYJ42071.1 Bacteroidetes-specific putative membrane protein [Flavobacterium beibuense]
MIKNYHSLFFILVFIAAFTKVSAQDAPVVTFNIPYQNNLKFNRFLYNPAFSFVREDNTYVSLYHRNQWVQFDDSPKVYMLTYTGRFSDKSGLGFGLYQQNVGVITSFGGVANYSYNIRLQERMNLTLGFNIAYYNSGVNKIRTVTGEPDPLIMELRNNSLVSIKPGINFNYKDFDLGVYAENVVDYDFKSDEMSEKYTDKTYSMHLMYTHKMVAMKDLFKDSDFNLGLRGKMSELYGFSLNGFLLVNFPRLGWLQTSVDNYYGVGIGAGFHLTKRLSLGYTYERTVKDGLVNLGPSHEIIMSFKLKDKLSIRQQNKKAGDTLAQLEEKLKEDEVAEDEGEEEEYLEKGADLEKLRMELDEDSQYLLDALIREDSINKINKAEFDNKVKNLKDYAKREQAVKLERAKTEMLNMKRKDPGEEAIEPQTVEDLKKARSGYYVVSTPPNAKSEDEVIIERYDNFTEAALALEKKKEEKIEKNPYLIHVEDSSDAEEENIRRRERENGVSGRSSGKGGQKSSTASQPKQGGSNPTASRSGSSSGNSSGGGNIVSPAAVITEGAVVAAKSGNSGNANSTDGNNEEGSVMESEMANEIVKANNAEVLPQSNNATAGRPTQAGAVSNANNSGSNKDNNQLTNNTKTKANEQVPNATREAKTGSKPPSAQYIRKEEDLTTEQEIKDYYAAKTDLVRQAPKRGDVLMIKDVEPGYYVIANVFSEQENTDKFINKLKDRGIKADFFLNPQNNFRYVYLKKHTSWRDALISYYSNVNNTYFDTVWLMSINVN